MATDFAVLGSAIYSALGGTAATPRAFYGVAPQGQPYPVTTINRQAAVDVYTFTSSEVSADYVVKVVSNRQWPGEAYAAYGTVHAALHGATLSVPGFTPLRCERQYTIEYQDSDRFWHVGGIYRVEIHST